MTAPGSQDRGQDRTLQRALLASTFLTGFTTLVYGMVWSYEFASVFGASGPATLSYLSAFLLTSAVGASLAARATRRLGRPARALAIIQVVVAVTALIAPLLFDVMEGLYGALLGGRPLPGDPSAWQPPLQLMLGALAFGLPAALLAAALPVAARASPSMTKRLDSPILFLGNYALGAAFGTALVAAFSILTIGPIGGLWLAVACNLLACGLVAQASRTGEKTGAQRTASDEMADDASELGFFSACVAPWLGRSRHRGRGLLGTVQHQPMWIYPAMLLTGATVAAYWTLWTHLLAHVLSGDLPSRASMLGSVAFGAAVGALLAGRFAATRERAATAFICLQVAAGLVCLLIYIVLAPRIPPTGSGWALAGYVLGPLLPVGLFFGACFSWASRIAAGTLKSQPADIGRIYAWSTVGVIAGCYLAISWLLPARGFEGTVATAVLVNLGLALLTAVVLAKPRPLSIGATASAFAIALVTVAPPQPRGLVETRGTPIATSNSRYFAVGPTTTVLLIESDGQFELRVDGRPEPAGAARGSPPIQSAERWLTTLPVLARPDAQSLLLLGLGGGAALEGTPPTVRRIEVVEPEPRVIDANATLNEQRNGDPLQDARVHVVNDDPRNALRLTDARFEIVVSQPSPPWTRTGAHLHTRGFFSEVKEHLTNNGVFVQRVRVDLLDAPRLRTIAATLRSEFGYVRLYRPGPGILAFLASDEPLDPELQLAGSGRPITNDVMHFSRMGINAVEDVLVALAADESGVEELAGDATVGTDNNQRAAASANDVAGVLSTADLDALLEPLDPLRSRGSWVYSQLADRVNFGYVTTRLIGLQKQGRALAVADAQSDEATRLLMVGLLYDQRGDREQADAAYGEALRYQPDNAQARYLLIRTHLAQLAQGSAPPEISTAAAALPPSAAAVVQGWQFAAAQNWESIAQIDGALGRASVTDAWYPEVVQLRAQWRGKVDQNVETVAFDALRLIDRGLSIEPEPNLYLLRAAVGITLRDAGIAVESSRYIVRSMRQRLDEARAADGQISRRELLIMQQNLNAIVDNLQGDLVARDQRRAEEVRQQANQVLRFIDAAEAAAQE